MKDYKQKYKEALEQAKKELEVSVLSSGSLDCATARVLFKLFPELQKSEDELIREELIHFLETCQDPRFVGNRKQEEWISWLEKQDKQEQLYIHFGEIPSDEKSKIYQGEVEVGTENGVSVYPAFKTNEGDIVLGLNLPITKTTLYTQQHLLEYDDRPCYLVKGDYIGKDTDGQSLINNISIIEKIDGYRIKEEKRDEQNPIEKVEPKFKASDWIVQKGLGIYKIIEVCASWYEVISYNDGIQYSISFDMEKDCHLWTVKDAKNGDILALNDHILMIKWIKFNNPINQSEIHCWCHLINGKFNTIEYQAAVDGLHPATKEQCNFLFQKMEEAGYKYDTARKKLILFSSCLE